jgi:hypothetical protein
VRGDIIYRDASQWQRLPKGTATHILTMGANDPAWAAPAGGGKVLQVLQVVDVTERTTSSTSYVTTSISQAITLASTSSKVLILVQGGAGVDSTGTGSFTIYRDSTDLTPASSAGMCCVGRSNDSLFYTVNINYLDSPATSGSVTYTLYWKTSTGNLRLGDNGANNGLPLPSCHITLIELSS